MGSDPPNDQFLSSDQSYHVPPSPGPIDQPATQPHLDSPEPLSEEDILRMRNRIVDLGLSLDIRAQSKQTSVDLTHKEKELGGMVVKLLQSFIDPTQLHRQAEFITWLGIQRDALVQSFEEERQRWEAEREGWTRMAEALLSQRARAANLSRGDEEVERQCAAYESENKSLRDKLQETHSRFSALESELNRLKPLLLMQPPSPFLSATSERPSFSQFSSLTEPGSSKEKRRPSSSSVFEEQSVSLATMKGQETPRTHPLITLDATPVQPRTDHYRRHSHSRSFLSPLHSRLSSNSTPARSIFSATPTPTHTHSPKKSRSKNKKFQSNLPPLSADARTEHLLLAARKIGRERANAVSGFMRRIEKEKEDLTRERELEHMDREHPDRKTSHNPGSNAYYRKDLLDLIKSPGSSSNPAVPKTPKRGANGSYPAAEFLTPTLVTPRSDFHPSNNRTPNSFVFVGAPAVASQTSSTSTPRLADRSASATNSTAKSIQTPGEPSTSGHPTPLASLLSAAKSMMDDESNESSPTPTSRRRPSVLEPPESPLPKRRRVGNGNISNGKDPARLPEVGSTPTSDRVRSALDVLADQAAAAFDSESQTPAKPPTKVALKNKGKDRGVSSRSVLPSEDVFGGDLSPNGRVNAPYGSPSHIITGSPVSTRSRSKVLLTDRLSKGASKTSQRRKPDESLESRQRSTPAPRMIFSPRSRSPVPPPSPPRASSPNPPNTVASNSTTAVLTPDQTTPDMGADSLEGDLPSRNGDTSNLSKPRATSPVQQGTLTISPSSSPNMAEDTRGPQPDTTSPMRVDAEAPVAKSPVMPVVAVISKDDGPNGERGERHVDDRKEGTQDRNEVAQVHSERSHFISDEDGPDTDADAEGEVDMDVEGTVILDLSSMALP